MVPIWVAYWNYKPHTPTQPGVWQDKNGTGNWCPYTKWGPGQPDNVGCNESCTLLYGDGLMYDEVCDGSVGLKAPIICRAFLDPRKAISVTNSVLFFLYV